MNNPCISFIFPSSVLGLAHFLLSVFRPTSFRPPPLIPRPWTSFLPFRSTSLYILPPLPFPRGISPKPSSLLPPPRPSYLLPFLLIHLFPLPVPLPLSLLFPQSDPSSIPFSFLPLFCSPLPSPSLFASLLKSLHPLDMFSLCSYSPSPLLQDNVCKCNQLWPLFSPRARNIGDRWIWRYNNLLLLLGYNGNFE